ncbi:hypothetical protein [Litoreibacter janthinus]|uniref:Uncharacterized protein n=1 Tax=Litoreibacter janthinus TaxID=670154 RepID=A0A1I6GYU7_9RHOB|nr:hypothetical protein [Litoreibacter janthinus]SFR47373.1 hypothetical protein SAMN04488002_2178 [Litoreibacter janthinus]
MIDILHFILGITAAVAFSLVVLAQLVWQGYRVYAGPTWLKPVAFGILAATAAVIAPPYGYQDLDRAMVATLLLFPLCLITLAADPGYWKLLSLGYLIAACIVMTALFQAAR